MALISPSAHPAGQNSQACDHLQSSSSSSSAGGGNNKTGEEAGDEHRSGAGAGLLRQCGVDRGLVGSSLLRTWPGPLQATGFEYGQGVGDVGAAAGEGLEGCSSNACSTAGSGHRGSRRLDAGLCRRGGVGVEGGCGWGEATGAATSAASGAAGLAGTLGLHVEPGQAQASAGHSTGGGHAVRTSDTPLVSAQGRGSMGAEQVLGGAAPTHAGPGILPATVSAAVGASPGWQEDCCGPGQQQHVPPQEEQLQQQGHAPDLDTRPWGLPHLMELQPQDACGWGRPQARCALPANAPGLDAHAPGPGTQPALAPSPACRHPSSASPGYGGPLDWERWHAPHMDMCR